MSVVKLKELRLKNFKSFSSARIPLRQGLTVIVGGNGSGKTNIIDALLFVLGTTSLKVLRASKLTDFINHNSVENYGKVELTLHDGEQEWVVSRLIDNRGKSVYRLNEKRKSLNEIEAFLNELGLRNDGHNIVAQGDVTRVIEKNPIERRQIIDEVAGIREFDEKKLEAEKELEKVDEKIKDIRIVLNERLANLRKLEEEKQAALEFEHLENRKKQLKASIISKEIEIAESLKKDALKKLKEFEKQAAELNASEKDALEKEDYLRKQIEQINEFMLAENQRVYAEVSAELESKKAEQAIEKEKKQAKEDSIHRNKEKEKELLEQLSSVSKEIASLKERISAITDNLQELEQRIKAKQKEKDLFAIGKEDSAEKVALINKKRLAVEQELDALQTRLHDKKVELHSIQKKNDICAERISDLNKQIAFLQKEIHELEKKSHLLNSLHFKSKNPMQELEQIEEKLFRVIEDEKEKKALVLHLQETLKKLKELESVCPICESFLSKEKKKSLIEKKKSSLKEHESARSELLKKADELKKRIADLKRILKEEQLLKNELKDFENKKSRLKELLGLLAKEKQAVKSDANLKEEIQGMQRKLEKLLKQKELVLKDVEKTQVGFIDKSFEELTNSLSELVNEQNRLLQEKNSIEKILLPKLEKEKISCEKQLALIQKENASFSKEIISLEKSIALKSKLIETLKKRFEKEKLASMEQAKKKDSLNEKITALKQKQETIKQKLLSLNKQQTETQVTVQTLNVRITDLHEETKAFEGIKIIQNKSVKEMKLEMSEIEKRIAKLGAINLKAIDSCEEMQKELGEVNEKVEKLEQEREAVLDLIKSIEIKRKEVFMKCFNSINDNFSKMFFNLFNGKGSLKLTDEENPFTAGLIIEAQHKGKGLQRIDAMSGGEKSLTALAFLFAIQMFEPAPFYVFDEADAALDKENSIKLGHLIKKMSKHSQFLMISHNDAIIKEADQIIGVTLNQNKSSVIGLNLKI